MRKIKLPFLIIPILVIVVSIVLLAGSTGNQERRELLLKVIRFAISNGHYNPAEVDNEYSEKAFHLFTERLDYRKRFLLNQDFQELKKYETRFDEAYLESDFTVLNESIEIINKRIEEAELYYSDILDEPFDFGKAEYVELDPEKLDYASATDELRERWRLSLKYETMTRLRDMLEEQEKAAEKSDTVTIKTFDELEAEAREKIHERYDDWFHRLSMLNDDDRFNMFVNSLVNVFDPHTGYFPPKDKENFDIRFSGQLEGIGAQLTQKNAYIEVVRIVPGSPSWKQSELEVGDYILKVAQEGEEPVDVVDMRLDEAVQLIRGPKGSTVTLTVKKLDGNIENISIVRDVVILEETYAKSAIVTDETDGLKIGYIKLPSFYVDFSNRYGRKSSDDVRKEIGKLKDEQVDGIIFDLRDNGGGSLEDVVRIAGLFIEEGPIVQVRGKGAFSKILRDTDRGVDFEGPLLVMINPISASASEIFAAAMQDYNRAVVIGSPSSYGKGTVQNFSDLDRMLSVKPADMEELGSLKMTVQKFYRVNGGATQLKGVESDIVVPDYYSYMDYGERDLDYALSWTKVQPLSFSHWTPSYDMDYVVNLSNERIENDSAFSLIEENGLRLKEIRDHTNMTLNFEDYNEMMEEREEESEKYERIGKDTLGLMIRSLIVDTEEMVSDTAKQARIEAWLTTLKKDVYLLEAYKTMESIDKYRITNARKQD